MGCQGYLNHIEAWDNGEREQKLWNAVKALDRRRCVAECEGDVLAWCCLMVFATAERGGELGRWARGMLDDIVVTAERRDELGKKFIPVPLTTS